MQVKIISIVKPQEVIDSFLAGGYFSIMLKDVGLNPSNFSNPILPTLQDIYTTISKLFFRDLILYYEITEVKTDSGIFFENFDSRKFLKFDKKIETLFLRSEDNYYNGESICSVQIRLSDNIHLQNREYRKMHNVFATTGGYMQMLNTIFTLLSIFPNKFFYDNIIVKNLFDFDIKKNKIISKHSQKRNNILTKKIFMKNLENIPNHIDNSINKNKILNLKIINKDENVNNDIRSERLYKNNLKKEKKSINNSINASSYEKINNTPKIEVIPFTNDLHLINNSKLIYISKSQSKNNNKTIKIDINKNEEKNYDYVHFNLNVFDYLCLGRCKQHNKNYVLFKKGSLTFKEKLDIINVFNCIILSEKMNEKEST